MSLFQGKNQKNYFFLHLRYSVKINNFIKINKIFYKSILAYMYDNNHYQQ